MKKNIKFIIFIILGIIALYFTKINYGDHSKNKSILACVIAQKNKSKDMTKVEAEKYCEDEINKNLGKWRKMSNLSSEQINQYQEDGYIAPLDILSKEEAGEIRQEIEFIEKKWPNELEGLGRNYVHLISPMFDKVSHNSKILDAVESIIGKNILICGTTLFIKNSDQKGFVSFHQDAKYIGLEPHNWVTAWLAVTDANEENGCMRMWKGSHKEDLKFHNQKFDENNLLTRGQTVENVSINETTPVFLKAGQLSLHHPKIVHGSGPNKSKDRRIGFAIQSYIGSNVDQVLGKIYVQQARGNDTFNYHKHVKRPTELMNNNDIATRKIANEELSKIFYTGSRKIGKY